MKHLEFAYLSEQGLRDNNEDACVALTLSERYALFVVIDGVGGEEAGEVAASITSETISSYFAGLDNITLDDLKMSVVTANNNIIDMQANPRQRHMSCVLTACIVDTCAGLIHICHVGDTRLYTLDDDNTLHKITPDHSWVGRLLDAGQISEEEARNHKRRNIINRALGLQRLDYFTEYLFTETITTEGLQQIMLCSDGVYDVLSSESIQTILGGKDSSENIVKTLVGKALKNGSHDNISAISIKLNKE